MNQQLIDAQQGDKQAYESVLSYAISLALPFLQKQSIPDFDCDDILQEILIGIHRSLPTYHPNLSFNAWLFSIIRFKMTDFFRQKYRMQYQELTDNLDIYFLDKDLDQDLIKTELMEILEQGLSQLTTVQQTVIRMMKLEGFSIKEVASCLALSESNVKINAFRGYRKLAKLLGSSSVFFICIFLFVLFDFIKKNVQ